MYINNQFRYVFFTAEICSKGKLYFSFTLQICKVILYTTQRRIITLGLSSHICAYMESHHSAIKCIILFSTENGRKLLLRYNLILRRNFFGFSLTLL